MSDEMFGLIALGLVTAGKLLDYVAPRTKTKVDDKVRAVFQWGMQLLPFVSKPLADKVGQASSEPPVVVARKAPTADAPGGVVVRDHRTK